MLGAARGRGVVLPRGVAPHRGAPESAGHRPCARPAPGGAPAPRRHSRRHQSAGPSACALHRRPPSGRRARRGRLGGRESAGGARRAGSAREQGRRCRAVPSGGCRSPRRARSRGRSASWCRWRVSCRSRTCGCSSMRSAIVRAEDPDAHLLDCRRRTGARALEQHAVDAGVAKQRDVRRLRAARGDARILSVRRRVRAVVRLRQLAKRRPRSDGERVAGGGDRRRRRARVRRPARRGNRAGRAAATRSRVPSAGIWRTPRRRVPPATGIARRRSSRFSWRASARQLLDVYPDAIAARRAGERGVRHEGRDSRRRHVLLHGARMSSNACTATSGIACRCAWPPCRLQSGTSAAGIPREHWHSGLALPLEFNAELVDYLKATAQGEPRDCSASRLYARRFSRWLRIPGGAGSGTPGQRGPGLSCSARSTPPIGIFVPPHNALSKRGLAAVARHGLNVLGSFLSFRPVDAPVGGADAGELVARPPLPDAHGPNARSDRFVYPFVLRYATHAEFGCHSLVPGTTLDELVSRVRGSAAGRRRLLPRDPLLGGRPAAQGRDCGDFSITRRGAADVRFVPAEELFA